MAQASSSARELLAASATDVDAVRQYLQCIEADELTGLLDGIAPRTACKGAQKTKEFLVQDDWLPLVHLLVQCEATRLRAASRIIQVLRRGSPSELESMQLLTEINLGYSSAMDELQSANQKQKKEREKKKLLEETHVVLDIVFSFLEEVVQDIKPTTNSKVLPQLLGLVPYFLGMMGELGDDEENGGTRENLAKLLELPWSCQTVPTLLDVLVDDSSLMSTGSWQQLQENVERMVTTSPEMANETMNPIIRECVLVANVTGDHKWIGIVRYLLRQLPVHLRQEAEFNLQMSFNQSPRIVSLVCESIRSSKLTEKDDIVMEGRNNLFDDPECGAMDLKVDWRDLFLLLHSLQASKPILHHRTSSSRVATEASVFVDIEQLAWWIVQGDCRAFSSTTSSNEAHSRGAGKTVEKHVLDQVELLLNFGGKQIHAREWKALLLMDIAFFWIEQSNATSDIGDKGAIAKYSLALMLLQSIFETTPETRSEVLSNLFESSQKPVQRKIAGETLSQLFISQLGKLFPHLNAIQDWLSTQFQRSFDSAREFFVIASRVATMYKDLYNFLMIFLRKLLSTGNRMHQQFAVDMWCTWLDHRLPFNEQQEEEIVSALKNSVVACHNIQAWSFGRLEKVFQCDSDGVEMSAISLRRSSWEEFHRFLSQEVGKFVLPTISSIAGYGNEDEDEFDDDDSGVLRFRFTSLDAFYQQNATLDGAASIGLIFQQLLSCLIAFEKTAFHSKVSLEGLPIEDLGEKSRDIKEWLVDLVSNWKYFFHWICQDSDDLLGQTTQGRVCEKSAWWKLVARIYIGCAICNITIDLLMSRGTSTGNSGDREVADQDLSSLCVDDCGISVWSLMEVEFSLHRMVQKLASHYIIEMETSLSKDYVRAVSNGLYRAIQPEKLKILTTIKNTLQEAIHSSPPQKRPKGMSFDAVLFALDSCCSALSAEGMLGTLYRRSSGTDDLSEGESILKMLLCLYASVRDSVVAVSDLSDAAEASGNGSGGRDQSVPRLQFSLYAASIAAKFPISARHLVALGKNARAVVLLDTKAGEEMLEHVCAAIGRTLEMLIKTAGLRSLHGQLGYALQTISWGGQSLEVQEGSSGINNFIRLSRSFLDDVKECVQLDGLTKLCVACASLSKRLRDIAAEMEHSDEVFSGSSALSSLAYGIMCDNVVYNSRLLRLLLSISLPIHHAHYIKTFMALESKIDGIIQACGMNSAQSTSSSKSQRQLSLPLKEKNGVSARRKRLRQGSDVRSSYGLRVDSSSDSDATYSSDSGSDDPSAAITLHVNGARTNYGASPERNRIPHLQSHATQSIAILAVLAVLEQSQSTLLSAIPVKNSGNKPCSFPHHQEILGYIRIHELVSKAISENRDFLWGTRKVLLKVLHMIEIDLRIGKASGAVRKGDNHEVGPSLDDTICIFEATVSSALRSRKWVEGIKDATQDSGTKTKVSATLLKMDIFFLQVPGTVQLWFKEVAVCDATKEQLKILVTLVKERIAPTNQTNVRRGMAKAPQRLLGVVPIVRKRRKRLRSRHPIIDAFLNEEDGADAFADLEDFIE